MLVLAQVVLLVLAGCTGAGNDGDGGGAAEVELSEADARCADPGGAEWRQVTLPRPPDAPAGWQIKVGDLLAGGRGGGWVAVGSLQGPDGKSVPAAWRSDDGEHWEADRMLPVTADGARQHLFGVARTGGVTVAMGIRFSVTEGRPRPAAWRAGDGVWREVPALRELFGGPRAIGLEDVAAGPAGFLVAGPWQDADETPIAGVWRSPDGLHWTRPPEGTPLTAQPGEVVYPSGVAAGAAGAALVGFTIPTTNVLERMEEGVVWRSRGGGPWERVDAGEVFKGRGTQQLTAVTATAEGFVAVGIDERDDTLRPAAWTSPDGSGWAQSPAPAFAGMDGATGDASLTSVTTADDCLLAGGVVGSRAHLWASGAGTAWASVPLPDITPAAPEQVSVAAANDQVLLALTSLNSSAVWFSPAA